MSTSLDSPARDLATLQLVHDHLDSIQEPVTAIEIDLRDSVPLLRRH